MIGDKDPLLLTDRQKEIMAIMITFRYLNGFWPSIREIGKSLSPPLKNPNSIWQQMNWIIKKGWIRRHRNKGHASTLFEVVP